MALDPPTFSLGDFDKNPGPSPQTQGPGPKPAAEETSQPAEAIHWRQHRAYLVGLVHAWDPDRKTEGMEALSALRDVLEARNKLDPRVTWSVDYQLAEKLGDQLEAVRTKLRVAVPAPHAPGGMAIFDDIDAAIRDLEAAIKTCNTLGLPF